MELSIQTNDSFYQSYAIRVQTTRTHVHPSFSVAKAVYVNAQMNYQYRLALIAVSCKYSYFSLAKYALLCVLCYISHSENIANNVNSFADEIKIRV